MDYQKPTRDELKATLSELSYYVTQENGTEPPFQNEFDKHNEVGIYVDIVSKEPLFASRDKFDSGCGWPAFAKPITRQFIKERADWSHMMHRIEVRSAQGDSHLGHVFNDGPLERGGMRYCINSVALEFIPKSEMLEKGYDDYLQYVEEE